MNRNYAYDPNYAYRQTNLSSLPIEEQLRMKFADRGLGAISANAARQSAQLQRPQPRPQPQQRQPQQVQPQMYAQARPQQMPQRPVQQRQPQQRPMPQQSRAMQPTRPVQMKPAKPQPTRPQYYEATTTRVPLPTAALVALLVCTLTVLSLVMGAAMVSRASDEVSDLRNEVAELSNVERELVQALDRKNDLRTIERIAVDELGMISTDLITKKYISFGGIDVIEAYEDEENEGVGLSTLLAAIGIGVE